MDFANQTMEIMSNYSGRSGSVRSGSGRRRRQRSAPSSITGSKMSKGQQKLSAQTINVTSPFREAMLFVALASSTMQRFAMVILIPFICAYDHELIKSYEIGILLAADIGGELIASRFVEPSISRIGTKWSIHLGFLFMVASSFAFWLVTYILNDSDFMAYGFLSRFVFGVGVGLLRSVIIIARAQSKKGKRDLQAKDYFKWHLQGEALGYLLGPLVVVISNHSRWENERTCMVLAIAQAAIWFIFTVCFVDYSSSTRRENPALENRNAGSLDRSTLSEYSMPNRGAQPPTPRRDMSTTDNFINSLLYNQVPLTAFLNRRTMLAFYSLTVGFILVTFVMPFFSLIRSRKSYEVSIQLTAALAVFFLASLFGNLLMKCIGPKRITFISLTLATSGCFILGKDGLKNEEAEQSPFASLFLDSSIAGYLLICVSIAFLTIASLDQVLTGTENSLLRTKFHEASNLHLFVESAFVVHSLVLFANVVGLIIGGVINAQVGMSQTCTIMGIFGLASLFIYVIFATFVYCTVHQENDIALIKEVDIMDLNQPENPLFEDPDEQRLLGEKRPSREDLLVGAGLPQRRIIQYRQQSRLAAQNNGNDEDEERKYSSSGSQSQNALSHNDSFRMNLKKDD